MTTTPATLRFVVLEEIGHGATGRVHLGWDRSRRRYVAVKVPLPGPQPPRPPHVLPVRHPHVLPHEVHDGLVVMPLVRGGSLLDLRAEHGPLPEAFVAVVVDQLLQALTAVHARGIVHRDVKPANLLLDATGNGRPHARLTDFGDEQTIGTRGYLAPEAEGKAESGAPAHAAQDVYAVGVLTRRLLDRPGPLLTLADAMSRPDPDKRPAAEAALARLRTLPLPRAEAWPSVPDRIGPLRRRRERLVDCPP